jgi:hypothetical protein
MAEKNTADHLTGHERLQSAPEHDEAATGGHDDIATLAYELWQARGCPTGSPEIDWFQAVEELRSRSTSVFEREEKTNETEH